ncbi:MAG: Crp/Fnr family transcriptional regulator [bacterium]|nr:Crp/Fnr family transcriptional regulator [bacterium]
MDYAVLEKSPLFSGVPADELKEFLDSTPHHMKRYEKGETVFRLMGPALHVGIILEGHVEAQKMFPNGNQVNMSIFGPGDMIGTAAAFSKCQKYPCALVALETAEVMLFGKDDLLRLMQKDMRILEHFTLGIATATYTLQQRLELFSYSGIAQKAAFWLLMQARQTGKYEVRIPGSVSKWAMLLNVSRPSLHRELRRLEEDGIISCIAPVITILDAGALEDVLSR